jgi:hypothetical protein
MNRFGVPLGGAPVPVGEAQLAAEVEHQRLERGRRVELEAHRVQLLLGRRQVGAMPAQVLDQRERVLLLLVEPDRHERGKVAVVHVVAQEHLRGGERRPLGDGVHLDRRRLLVRELRGRERVPGHVAFEAPAHALERFEGLRVDHLQGHDSVNYIKGLCDGLAA